MAGQDACLCPGQEGELWPGEETQADCTIQRTGMGRDGEAHWRQRPEHVSAKAGSRMGVSQWSREPGKGRREGEEEAGVGEDFAAVDDGRKPKDTDLPEKGLSKQASH